MSHQEPPYLGQWVAEGRDPDPLATAVLRGTVLDPTDLAGLGIEERVAHFYARFEDVARSRAIMRLARDAGIPFSEAQHRWRDPDDLAAELAWDNYQREVAARCCPDCGIDPAMVADDEGRTRRGGVPVGVVKVAEFFCPACDLMEKARRDQAEAQKKNGGEGYGNAIKHRFEHRHPGEPLID